MTTTPEPDPTGTPPSVSAMLLDAAERVEAILDGAPVAPPIALSAALAARGINARVTLRHVDLNDHELMVTLDNRAAQQIADRIEASDLGLALRRAAVAFEATGRAAAGTGAALRSLLAATGYTPEEIARLAAELDQAQEQQA